MVILLIHVSLFDIIMATLYHYECTNPKCKFSINTEPYGHYALMSGHSTECESPQKEDKGYIMMDD